jgi:bacterial/archaeal transporter family protein
MLDTKLDHVALIFSACAILMWGCWGFFGKLGLGRGMSPRSILFAELLVGGVGAAVVLIGTFARYHSAAPAFEGWNIFGVCSGLGLLLGLVFFYLALAREPVSLVVPLTATYPAVSVLLSYIALAERPTPSQWIGLLCIVVGAVLLLAAPAPAPRPG